MDLGWAEARAGRPAEARAALAHARSLDLPDWMKISAGGAYLLAGDATAAAQVASDGLAQMTPRLAALSADGIGENDLWGAEYLARGWYVLGSASLERGDQAEAERYLDAAWRVWFLPDAAWALGNLREKQARQEEAVVFWSMASSVPTADWSLPPDREKRIEVASRKIVSPKSQFPGSGAMRGPYQVEANQQLLNLRTVNLAGPVLGDLAEEVLVLARQDGTIEQIENLTRKNPADFSRQVAKLDPARLALTSPDGVPFKAVRRGLLACSRATSCVIVVDLPGVGGLRWTLHDSGDR